MGNIIILGAGGFAPEVNDALEAGLRAAGSLQQVLGYVVDAQYGQPGNLVAGKPILGDFDWLASQDMIDLTVICGVGSPRLRYQFSQKVKQPWHQAIHPFSSVSPGASLERGVVILAGCVVGSQARLGQHVTLNRLCSIGHATVLEDFVTVSPGANIAGNVRIGTGCFIGIGSSIIENITIGKWSMVAAGSVITKDIPPYSTVAGSPGRVIKTQSDNLPS
jgi:sugar O-acyltransferase (sialic acid O-acetyltransferase NeuD family)